MQIKKLQIISRATSTLASGDRPLELVGPWGSGKTLAAVQTAEELGAPLLIVTAGRVDSEAVYDDLCTFVGEGRASLFPAWEVLPSDAMNPADDIVAERMNTLKRLAGDLRTGEAAHAVIPVRSLMQYVVNREHLLEDTVVLRAGEEHDLEDLTIRLSELGYKRELMVEQRGETSVRGGILDVFPISSELPYRLEFFGDEIESIRRFEPETQRSIERVDEIQILPRSEKAMLLAQGREPGRLDTILEYFPDNTLVTFDEPAAIDEEAALLETQYGASGFFIPWQAIRDKTAQYRCLALAQVAYAKHNQANRITYPMSSIMNWGGDVSEFWAQLEKWDLAGYTVRLICNNPGERHRLHELLEEHGYRPGQGQFDLAVEIGRLRGGFCSGDDRLAVLSEREIFGRRYVRRHRRRFEAGSAITTFSDLKVGDYVVHVEHGIGRYLGLRRFEGKAGDFLSIKYSGGDIMYLPVTHIDHVQKYIGGDGSVPKVDKLGGATWARRKARVKKAVRDMTEELLKLYARRETQQGVAFSPDAHWQHEFEDAFEYDETPDQAQAIDDVKRDMESRQPMDRLVCGDVGYGKTEVAMRAAFKAVMEGKQVAVLVPTTVLAQQHYETFKERMADYPVRIGLLCRFKTGREITETTEKTRSGEIDILIGTHRILSKDVEFNDLGLVVIDEEQRFGVAHKEKLKTMKASVDVVTMSATPIPRTLQFSLMGVRDMSVINTAPNDRLPIHTCIEAFDEHLVREAIEREIGRQGQVFYLHNRVQTIEHVAASIKKLVPQARIGIGHGQMPKHRLEEVMAAFVKAEIDVLVCTTIIGSGLDIPNANTIIVDRADCFGLSELYQLRGRVGRYKHRAFAYLLVPSDRALSEDAQKRLKALEDFSSLGAGFRIAMRDLEIRGCGNVLGGEQHGHIAAVGYDAYTQLIAEAVGELKGEPVKHRQLPPLDTATEAFIPEQYVPSEAQKITLYKRISSLQSVEEADEILEEVGDRYGPPPAPVKRLVEVMRVRALGADAGAQKVAAVGGSVSVAFEPNRFISRKALGQLQQRFGAGISYEHSEAPALTLRVPTNSPEGTLAHAADLLRAISEL